MWDYSNEGLRTLVIGEKIISKEEYHLFKKDYVSLKQSLDNKEYELNELYDYMERDLHYIGCSAIEDKLQEDVAVTI